MIENLWVYWIMLIYRFNYESWCDKEIYHWNLHRITRLYNKAIWCRLVHFASFCYCYIPCKRCGFTYFERHYIDTMCSRDVVELKVSHTSRVRRFSWSVLNWLIYYWFFAQKIRFQLEIKCTYMKTLREKIWL